MSAIERIDGRFMVRTYPGTDIKVEMGPNAAIHLYLDISDLPADFAECAGNSKPAKLGATIANEFGELLGRRRRRCNQPTLNNQGEWHAN